MTTAALPAFGDDGAPPLATTAVHAFPRRIGALLIDLFVLALLDGVINAVFGAVHITSGSAVPQVLGAPVSFTTRPDVSVVWLVLVGLLYFGGLEALFGATPGKWLLRLRIADLAGGRPTGWAVSLRTLLRLVDGLPGVYLVGGLVAVASPLRQRLGDRLARTVVVDAAAVAGSALTRAQLRWRPALSGLLAALFLVGCGAFEYTGRPPLVIQGMITTHQMMFRTAVRSYSLNVVGRGRDTITYDIHYQTAGSRSGTCNAVLTLHWTGFLSGWTPANGIASCWQHLEMVTPTP